TGVWMCCLSWTVVLAARHCVRDRLDILHPRLWGRGDGVRSVMRVGAEAAAPLLFGILSDTLGGGGRAGMQYAFLVTLMALFEAGGLVFGAAHQPPRRARSVHRSVATSSNRRRQLSGYRGSVGGPILTALSRQLPSPDRVSRAAQRWSGKWQLPG